MGAVPCRASGMNLPFFWELAPTWTKSAFCSQSIFVPDFRKSPRAGRALCRVSCRWFHVDAFRGWRPIPPTPYLPPNPKSDKKSAKFFFPPSPSATISTLLASLSAHRKEIRLSLGCLHCFHGSRCVRCTAAWKRKSAFSIHAHLGGPSTGLYLSHGENASGVGASCFADRYKVCFSLVRKNDVGKCGRFPRWRRLAVR